MQNTQAGHNCPFGPRTIPGGTSSSLPFVSLSSPDDDLDKSTGWFVFVLFFLTITSLGSVPFSGLRAGGGGSCFTLKGLGFDAPIEGNDEEEYVGDLGDDKEEPEGEMMPPRGLNAEPGY